MLNWIVWNRSVFGIEIVLTPNWIVRNISVLIFILTCKLGTYAKLNCLNGTVLIFNYV